MKNLVQIPTMLVLFNKLKSEKDSKISDNIDSKIAAHILGIPGLGRKLCKVLFQESYS